MCQRIVIALALACRPQLLIADEPTTGLDVTTQKAVMDLVVELTRERGMSTILITHDLGLAAAYCDRVVGDGEGPRRRDRRVRARSSARREHAYTRKLMRATPRPGVVAARPPARGRRAAADGAGAAAVADETPLLAVENLVKEYPRQGAGANRSRSLFRRDETAERTPFRAVDGICFTVGAARASASSASPAAASPPPR